jgi:hypothetical protein
MNDHNNIRKFCEHHGIKVLDRNKRAYRYSKINTEYFSYEYDYNKVTSYTVQETEPLWTVEISESELEKIVKFEEQVFNNAKKTGHYDLFTYMLEQKEKEKFLKEKYPAVKKAYEQYSLILKLAESGEL